KPNTLLGPKPIEGKLVVTHREIVVNCPKDFEVIGSSDDVRVDAIAHKKLPIWGFQSHPEATEHFLMRKQGDQELKPEELKLGHQIMRAFLERVANSSK